MVLDGEIFFSKIFDFRKINCTSDSNMFKRNIVANFSTKRSFTLKIPKIYTSVKTIMCSFNDIVKQNARSKCKGLLIRIKI